MTSLLPMLEEWFTHHAGRPGRRFGKAGARYEGFSDGIDGVQWNCGIDRVRGVVTVGVNLEGMKYDGGSGSRFVFRWPDCTPAMVEESPSFAGVRCCP